MATECAPVTSAEGGRVEAYLSSLQGRRLRSVVYRCLRGMDGSTYDSWPPIHATVAGVLLAFDDKELLLTWAMKGALEGIAVASDHEACEHTGTVPEDVSATGPWEVHVAQRLCGFSLAWHVSDEHQPEAVWAVTLHFPEGLVSVALGEGADGVVRYMPDELAIFFGTDAARRYWPHHAPTDATGRRP